jgi:hypothetical protein
LLLKSGEIERRKNSMETKKESLEEERIMLRVKTFSTPQEQI